MKKNKFVKCTSSITALAILFSLSTSGCSIVNKRNDKFSFKQSITGEMLVKKDDYIEHQYINNYYVIELYNWLLDRSSIHIAYKSDFTNGIDNEILYSKYTNIFNNNLITCEPDEKNYYELINITSLNDYLSNYDLAKDKYNYEDMQEIYKVIKENYEFKNNKPLSRKLK